MVVYSNDMIHKKKCIARNTPETSRSPNSFTHKMLIDLTVRRNANGSRKRLARAKRYVAIVREERDTCANRIKIDAVDIAIIAAGNKTYALSIFLIFFICYLVLKNGLINIQINS